MSFVIRHGIRHGSAMNTTGLVAYLTLGPLGCAFVSVVMLWLCMLRCSSGLCGGHTEGRKAALSVQCRCVLFGDGLWGQRLLFALVFAFVLIVPHSAGEYRSTGLATA